MRILGLDPSLTSTGWADMVDGKVVSCGTIKTSTKDGSFEERLDQIWLAMTLLLTELMHNDTFNAIAIEDVFVNRRNMKTSIQLAKVHGVVIAAVCSRLNGEAWRIQTYEPKAVKLAVTGSGRANKEQVIKMVRLLAGYKGKQDDEADAIAVALTCERYLSIRAPK